MRVKEPEDTDSEVCPENCDDESYSGGETCSGNQVQKPFGSSASFNFCFSAFPKKTARQVASVRERFNIQDDQPEAAPRSATSNKQNLSLGSAGKPAIFSHDNVRPSDYSRSLSQQVFQVHQPVSGTQDEKQPSAVGTPEEDAQDIIAGACSVEPRAICCEKILKQTSVDRSTDTSLDSVDSGVIVYSESNEAGKMPSCSSCATQLNPAVSGSKRASEHDFAEAWRDRDLNQINVKINELKAIQTQMAELSQEAGISSHKKTLPSLNVTDCELEENEKLQEICDMLVLLENLKWKLQFTKISSVISETKKEVDQIYSSVMHHSECELEKATKNKPGEDDILVHRGLPVNPKDNTPPFQNTPAASQDSTISEGIPFSIPKRHICITVKDRHEKVSLEELRLEHYLSCPESRPGVVSPNARQRETRDSSPGGWLSVPACPEPPEILTPQNLVLTDVGMKDSTSGLSKLLPEHSPSRESDRETAVKYAATLDIDIVTGNYVVLPINTRLHAITAMEEYRHKSNEELRLEHYLPLMKDAPQQELASSQNTGGGLVTRKKIKKRRQKNDLH
ncbi:uncharacterized protein [Macrobrachium rosenbergii]|uniref:uncharacterized protein n=1 Tax=Macrobrachium rosenbergii TaxID=79674 RepID=UPI0034D603D2